MRFSLSLLCSVCLLSTLLLSGCTSNSETAEDTKGSASADRLELMDLVDAQTKKFDDAMAEFMKIYQQAETEEAKQSLVDEKLPKAEDFTAPLMQIAEDHPDEDAAVEALLWVVKRSGGEDSQNARKKLLSDYIAREELQEICMSMSYQRPSAEVHSDLQTLMTDSPHDFVKGTATFALANYLTRCKSAMERTNDEAQDDEPSEEDKSTKEFLASLDVSDAKIKSLYQTAADKYGDVQYSQNSRRKLKSMATGAIFEMENLAIGQEAPDIAGKDLDGVEFKLSEYRGKVVVIDFWGDW